ncbi:MAG TPA: RNA polymerase sigma factor region1.1 domain-containing protein, partial [Bacillota bacterium]|nr:RNA polymerase sigma factor region1.1 domain-containing protein [Bacillota bacterium]
MNKEKDIQNIEGIKELIARGRRKGVITYREIMNTLEQVELSPDEIDDVYEALSRQGIE